MAGPQRGRVSRMSANASAWASNIVAGTYRLVRERSMDCEVRRHWLDRSGAWTA